MPKDILGVEIKPNCFIAYGVRSGNSGGLRIGKVRAVKKAHGSFSNITVVGVNFDYYGDTVSLGHAGNFTSPERALVISEESLPMNIRVLYEKNSS